MLSSSAKPPPPPPPQQQEKLKSDGDDDEAVVDLLKCSDDNSHTHPNKFSIRDYVFGARGKDIKTHWPFSPENLQLCLRNGVTEVLPPFETIETLKAVIKPLDEHASYLTSGPDSSKNAGLELALGDNIENFKSNSPEQEEDEEYMPDVNPVPFQTKSSFRKVRKPATTFRASGKARSNITTQGQGKKCRLIVKLGNNDISEPTSNEWDFSESPMASSKVCPVCKTFTSSSNTTLNAHIDQCLCGESKVMKRTEIPKEVIVKHRIIKPRKVRLMVDIYKTALGCTLEDLDRRNGTNWASNLSFPALGQENVDNNSIISEGKKEGAVYIDSNGTKVCILSKLCDMNPNTNGEDDCGPRKLLERDKVSKILPSNKKKLVVQRETTLKWPPYERRRCSPEPGRSPEKVKFSPEENEKDGSAQPLKAACHEREHDQLKSNGSGLIKQRTGSKKSTGHKMKTNPDQKSRNPDKIVTLKNSRIKSGQLPSLDDYKLIRRTHDLRLPISTPVNIHPNTLSANSESHKRKEIMEQQPCLTNRAGYSLFDSQDFDHGKKTKNNHMTLLQKRNFKRRKENRTSFPNGKEVERLSPFSKSSMPMRHASFSESKNCLGSIKSLKFKKSSPTHIQNNTVDTRTLFDHRARALKMQKRRMGVLKSTSPSHSNASSESHSHGFEHSIDSYATDDCIRGGMSGSLNADETRDEFVSELISKISGGEPRSLAYEEKMLCAANDLLAEVNGNEGEEGNYFIDVDPIPIPSPPGSFLPSPGRMGSEELQGNSTLTSCQVHSSGNEPNWIDRRDPSDSPISGPSFVSNSIAFRSHAVKPPVVEISNPNRPSMDSPNARSVFAESRFPIGGDCESRSPSTPNSIFRLMGKNLMVANKEEDCVPKIGHLPVELSMTNESQKSHSSVRENPQHFDHQPRPALLDMTSGSGRKGFVSSMDCHGYEIRHVIEKPQNTPFVPLLRNPHSWGGGREGIMVMNDPSDFRRTCDSGNMHVGPMYYEPRHVGPTRYNPLYSGSSQIDRYSSNYNLPPGNGMNNGNQVSWSRTGEGRVVTTGHERSSFYFTTGVCLPTKFA